MHRYYQTGEKGTWIPIRDGADVQERALEAGAKKLTILAVSEIIDEETTDKHNLSYKGPLYFDIDCKEDLNQAIRSAVQLVERLKKLDVPENAIELDASGSKGVHVIVPSTLFSSGRPVKNLPLIYREMALELHVMGLDFQVYSQGRGVSWRLLNVRRADGAFPVPLTVEELRRLNADSYRELVKNPRAKVVHDTTGLRAPGLEALFERAKKRVRAKPQAVHVVPEEALIKIRDITPNCVEELCHYKVKADVNYNQVAMQLAAYAARAGVSEEVWQSQASRMAESAKSSQYSTARLRYDHTVGVVRYALSNRGVKFSCNAMRSVLANRVCEGCVLYQGETEDTDAGLEIGIVEKEDGYYIWGEKTDRRISTFVLNPLSVFLEEPQGGGQPIRRATRMEVLRNGERLATINFDESSWTSRAGFNRELEGISNLSFIGTDLDVQRIKHTVYEEGRTMEEVTQVSSAGIHFHKIGRREVLVYVEPGYSYNQLQVAGTHTMANEIQVPPQLKHVDLPENGDKALTQALTHLLKINAPDIVAQILGWVSACHLKAQFMRRYSQFPVLSLWGAAGSGKNKTSELFTWINGVQYGGVWEPLMLPGGTTQHSVVAYCGSTTTLPRILDEYNRSKLGPKMYDLFGEILKGAWGGTGPGKGTPRTRRGGAPEMVQDRITSPIIVLSEQAPMMPALQHRSVQIAMSRHRRLGCEEDFEAATELKHDLLPLAKALTGMALRTDIKWVEERMSRYRQAMPKALEDRPRYSYQLLLTGLDFVGKTLREFGIPLTDQIADLKQSLLDTLQEKGESMAQSKNWTEVDAVFEQLGVMITLSDDFTITHGGIQRGKHFITVDNYMYLDMPIVHALYCQHMSRQKQTVPIDNLRVLMQLLEQESYYVGQVVLKDMTAARPVVQLDLRKMQEKGHQVTQFEGA